MAYQISKTNSGKNAPTKNTEPILGKRRRKRKKSKRKTTPSENLSQKTPSGHHKPKLSPNYQTFSEDTKKIETRVRKNKIENLKSMNLFVDLFVLKYLLFSLFGPMAQSAGLVEYTDCISEEG